MIHCSPQARSCFIETKGIAMTITRRALVAGAAALAAPAFIPHMASAASATRTWGVRRAGRDFGVQQVTVQRSGSTSVVDFQTRLKGIILLIPVSYQLNCREIWEGGVLQSIESKCRQNGEDFFVSARRQGDGMKVSSTRFNGVVPGRPGTSTFFVSDIVQKNTWISTQTGKPMKVNPVARGKTSLTVAGTPVACTRYYCGGELRYPIDAFFDAGGELIAYFVDALGQKNEFVATALEPRLRPLWA